MSFLTDLKLHKDALAKAAELTTANADLQATITSLMEENSKATVLAATAVKERDAAIAERDAAKLAATEFDAKVEKAASQKALTITQTLGTTTQTATGGGSAKTEIKGVERWNVVNPEFAPKKNLN